MTSLYRATKTLTHGINTLSPRQNGRHFPDDIFKCIFLNENVWVPIEISLKFVPKGPINNIPALVQIMAWRRSGDKPLSEPMMVSLLTHICVTRPQWVKSCITYQMTRYFPQDIRRQKTQTFLVLTSCWNLPPRMNADLKPFNFSERMKNSKCVTLWFCAKIFEMNIASWFCTADETSLWPIFYSATSCLYRMDYLTNAITKKVKAD